MLRVVRLHLQIEMGKLTTLVGLIALCASFTHGKVYADLEQLDSAKESYDFVVVGGSNIDSSW
jgi:hypothetical protein